MLSQHTDSPTIPSLNRFKNYLTTLKQDIIKNTVFDSKDVWNILKSYPVRYICAMIHSAVLFEPKSLEIQICLWYCCYYVICLDEWKQKHISLEEFALHSSHHLRWDCCEDDQPCGAANANHTPTEPWNIGIFKKNTERWLDNASMTPGESCW